MSAVFLSASVPVPGRGEYYKTANPFLIQTAVRELVATVLGRKLLVWGGHPAITPMVWAVCEDLGVDYSRAAVLYQSTFFKDIFPEENKRFRNVKYVEKVDEDRAASLTRLREEMLGRNDLATAIFIGGMEGVTEEYHLFRKLHASGSVIAVPAPGGAARDLTEQLGEKNMNRLDDVDFAKFFHTALRISPNEKREL